MFISNRFPDFRFHWGDRGRMGNAAVPREERLKPTWVTKYVAVRVPLLNELLSR